MSQLKVGCGFIVPWFVSRMRALLCLGDVSHLATAGHLIAFASPMPLVGAPAAGNVGIGDLTTIHRHALFDRLIP